MNGEGMWLHFIPIWHLANTILPYTHIESKVRAVEFTGLQETDDPQILSLFVIFPTSQSLWNSIQATGTRASCPMGYIATGSEWPQDLFVRP